MTKHSDELVRQATLKRTAYTSKSIRNECKEDCKNKRQHGSSRCKEHVLN